MSTVDDPSKVKVDKNPANRDPITGAPGAHPVGVGAGAAAGGAAIGAAAGAVAGPAGAIIGSAIGAVAGGLAGKAVAEKVDPTVEDAYWRNNHASRSYASGSAYERYQPAYRYGWESASRYPGKRFEDVERELERDWSLRTPAMPWQEARPPIRDAWSRIRTDQP